MIRPCFPEDFFDRFPLGCLDRSKFQGHLHNSVLSSPSGQWSGLAISSSPSLPLSTIQIWTLLLRNLVKEIASSGSNSWQYSSMTCNKWVMDIDMEITFAISVVENNEGSFFVQNVCKHMLVVHGVGETLYSGALLLWRNSLASWHSIRSETSISAKTRELFFNVFHAELSKRAYYRLPLNMENWMPKFHPQKTADEIQKPYWPYLLLQGGYFELEPEIFFTLKRKCWRKSANEVGRCFCRG